MTKRPDQYGCVGVLMGGISSEAEISMKSGKAVSKALKESGCVVKDVLITSGDRAVLKDALKKSGIDIAFIAMHGQIGEDGIIQSVLEELSIPYTGSDVDASRRAFNKISTQKKLMEDHIDVPQHVIVNKKDGDPEAVLKRTFQGKPFVVKPAAEGSSIGVTIVKDFSQASDALQKAFEYGPEVICEQYISGREMTVGILGDTALPVIEILPRSEFFDFDAKYKSNDTGYIVPAVIDEKIAQKLQKQALDVFHSMECSDLSRVDLIYCEEDKKGYVLEINTIPGFTSTSLLPKAAQVVGIDFNELCLRILELAYVKKEKEQKSGIS